MKLLLPKTLYKFLFIAMLFVGQYVEAQVTVNGTIAAGEYGSHVNGDNQQNSGASTWYMTWDATNLYIAITTANATEGAVLYLDKNPISPVNGGGDSDGTLVGQAYDGSNFAALPFRADLVVYFKNGYSEYRVSNGTGGWSAQMPYTLDNQYSGNNREIAIPWAAIGGQPSAFNWLGYVTYSGGGAYATMPNENAGGTIGSSARWSRYYTVSTMSTLPFKRNSYTFTSNTDIAGFGAFSVYDFTMNSTGRFISRTGNTSGDWTIGGNLTVGAGIIFLGNPGATGNTNIAGNLNVLGGTYDMDKTTAATNVLGDVNISSGASLKLATVVGGDLNIGKNWSNSGTFTPNTRQVTFNGTAAQTLTGDTTFDYLRLNNPAGLTLLSRITVATQMSLTSGKVTLGANNFIMNASASFINNSATSYLVTNSTGALVRNSFGATPLIFPVGLATSYTPLTIANTGTARDLSLKVTAPPANAVYDASKIVNLQWDLNSSGVGAITNVTFNWNSPSNVGAAYNASGTGDLGIYTTGPDYAVTAIGTMAGSTKAVTGIALASGSNKLVIGNTHSVFVPQVIWNGSAWSNITGPTASISAIIEGDYTTTSSTGFSAYSLKVNTGGSLTINSGDTVTVVDKINNTLTSTAVVVENNGNLIQGGTTNQNSGTITVKRNSAALMRQDYTLWSSPTTGSQTLLDFSPATLANRFYTYNPANDLFVLATPSTTTFAAANSYLIRMPNNHPSTSTLWEGVFNGVPNNGNISVPATIGKFTAVGNPYPSTIDANKFISDNAIGNNAENSGDGLYFWRKTNNVNQATAPTTSYATYTTAGGVKSGGDTLETVPNGVIQVGQGFIVKATTASLNFNNDQRIDNHGDQFLRTATVERHRIWLNLSSAGGANINQMMVAYMTGATQGIDAAIDARYFNDSPTALNSLLNNEEFAIQGRSLPFETSDVVPMQFKAAAGGTYTIAIDHVDGLFTESQDIYLRDALTGVEHDLKSGGYSFATEAGTFSTRFEIVYTTQLGTNNPTLDANAVVIYKNDNQSFVINSGNTTMSSVKVFDIRGRLLTSISNINATQTIVTAGQSNEVLLVQVTSTDGATITKKVVR